MVSDSFQFKDSISIYNYDPITGEIGDKVLETNTSPSILQKLMCKLGFYKYANDILMNEGLVDIAAWISSRYSYIGVGTDGTNPSVTTYHNLISPVMARSLATKSITTTYVANDTAQFIGIFTPGSSYTILETGIFKDLTTSVSDVMLCRQTISGGWSVTAGQSFVVVWQIICARG